MTPRALAVRALMHQEQDGYSNLVLDAELKRCMPPLDARDTAFATRIFYTTVERQRLLDYCLMQFIRKPLAKLDAPVRAILRAGLAQAKFLDVPVSAAVNESVKLTRAFGKSSAAGMVNAVLRRATGFTPDAAAFSSPVQRLAVLYSLSDPVAKLLWQCYGEESFSMAEAFYTQPGGDTAIRVNTLKTTDEALASALTGAGCAVRPGPWPHCLLVKFAGSPAATDAFRQGLYHVQGLASQFAADCVAARPGQRVLDLCAAPGGKSLTLAYAMGNTGTLISCDAVKSRLPLIESAFARCGVTCGRVLENDASRQNPVLGQFDRILCDVPCSGLGVIRKKPDVRYKSLQGLESLVTLQGKILEAAASHLAENGRLVYSTCTVNPAENQDQVRAFCTRHPEFSVLSPAVFPNGVLDTGYGTLLLPNRTGTDGFFAAILIRRREKSLQNSENLKEVNNSFQKCTIIS